MPFRHVAQPGQEGVATTDLVGLRGARGDELLELDPALGAKGGEDRRHAAVRSAALAMVRTADGRHGVVESRQRVVVSREEQEVDGGQQQERALLRRRGGVEQRQDVGVGGDPTADGGVGRPAVTLDHVREGEEVIGHRHLEHGQ